MHGRAVNDWIDQVHAADADYANAYVKVNRQVKNETSLTVHTVRRPPYPAKLAAGQGALAVFSDVSPGRVLVDGIDRGPLPLEPFALNAGRHTVRVVPDVTVVIVPGIVVDALLLTGRAPGR